MNRQATVVRTVNNGSYLAINGRKFVGTLYHYLDRDTIKVKGRYNDSEDHSVNFACNMINRGAYSTLRSDVRRKCG